MYDSRLPVSRDWLDVAEGSARRRPVRRLHRHARHRARVPGIAAVDRAVRGRRHLARVLHLRRPRGRVFRHAVLVRAADRRAVRSLRPPAGDPARPCRHGRELLPARVRAVAVAVCARPDDRRRVRRDVHGRRRLSRGHHTAGEARAELRVDRRRVRLRLHHGAGARRSARRRRLAATVRRRGLLEPRRLRVRVLRAAGVARAREPQTAEPEVREPRRRACERSAATRRSSASWRSSCSRRSRIGLPR